MKETAHYGLSQYETEHDKFRIISGERNLNTDMQIIDAVLHGHAMSLAAEYDEQRTYVRNDFCLHNDSLLRYTGRGLQYSGPHELSRR